MTNLQNASSKSLAKKIQTSSVSVTESYNPPKNTIICHFPSSERFHHFYLTPTSNIAIRAQVIKGGIWMYGVLKEANLWNIQPQPHFCLAILTSCKSNGKKCPILFKTSEIDCINSLSKWKKRKQCGINKTQNILQLGCLVPNHDVNSGIIFPFCLKNVCRGAWVLVDIGLFKPVHNDSAAKHENFTWNWPHCFPM